MLWKIVGKDLVEHITSFRFLAVFVFTVMLMVTSVLVFSVRYRNAVEEYPRRVEGLVNKDGKTHLGSVPCEGGATVRRFPSALAFISGTGEREFPNGATFAVHGLRAIWRAPDIRGVLGSSAQVDWAFVVSVLLSFAAGLLTYKAISGELRDGTLALMLSNPVSRGTVLLAKYLAALIPLAAALSAAMAFSLIVLQATGAVQLTGDDWLKIGFVWLASLLYLSIFVLIGLLCSVFARSPLFSAVAFMFTWTCLVFVVPNLGGILARQMGDIKTPLQMKELSESVPDRFPLTPGMSDAEVASVKLKRELARERLLIEYVQSMVRQVHLGQNLTRISPSSAFSYAVENIVGGGTYRLMRFIDNVVRFREGFFRAIIEADKKDPQSEHHYEPWRCGSSNFSQRVVDLGPAKEFRDPPPSSIECLHVAFMDMSLLILYNGLLFLITFLRFARQDISPVPGV